MPSGLCRDCLERNRPSREFHDGAKEGLIKQLRNHHLESSPKNLRRPDHNCHWFLIFDGDNLDGEMTDIAFASGEESRDLERHFRSTNTRQDMEILRTRQISLRRAKEGD